MKVDKLFERLIAEAAARARAFDELERQHGVAGLDGAPIVEHARTVEAALEAALKTADWSCAADAFVMLRAVIRRLNEGALS